MYVPKYASYPLTDWLFSLGAGAEHGTVRSHELRRHVPTRVHRFRTKRQLWAYSGFAIETHDSGEYRYVKLKGKLRRNRERTSVRGLSDNHNHDLKNLSKALLY